MPTYDYVCDACGNAFEKFQSMSSAPIKKCPKCGKNKLRRLIGTGAGLIFKGSGFYITDYREKGYSEKASADKAGGESSEAPKDKPAEKANDAKPAETKAAAEPAKTESKPAAESKPVAKAETAKASRSAKKK